MVGRLRRLALGISTQEASFARRGFFIGDARVRQRLERVGSCFIEGYLIGLEVSRPESIAENLKKTALELRGFAFEGAAMACALLDGITPWRRSRLARLIDVAGGGHIYMLHVGAGWAMARLPHLRWRVASFMARFEDPLLRWLVLDGYGFHEGYFRWRQCFLEHAVPTALSPYGRRVFDQGLGRSLWFVSGGDAFRAVSLLNGLASERRPDVWSGLGLACAYAGGCDQETLIQLRQAADGFLPHLQQGVAFAAKARQRAGNMSAETDAACGALCDMSSREAAAVTDQALESLPAYSTGSDGVMTTPQDPAYETWRSRVREKFRQAETKKAPAMSGVRLTAPC